MTLQRLSLFSLPALVLACQVLAGIEERDEYRPPSTGGAAGSPSEMPGGDGGTDSLGGAGGTSGGATGGTGDGGSGDGGSSDGGSGDPGPQICGDGVVQGTEACDDGEDNGSFGKCHESCAFVCVGNCPVRVDPTIETPGDGSSWEAALDSLQAAVDQQWMAGGGEVWVKTSELQASSTASLLVLRSSVHVYGGFSGTELRRDERPSPTKLSATVLDANHLSYPAIIGAGNARLDGFVVRRAAGDSGPAFQAQSVSNVVLRNVYFSENHATTCGGALLLDGASVRLEGGSFESNESDATGGAICIVKATTLEIDGTRFENNAAATQGGAILAVGTYAPEAKPTLTLKNVTFLENGITGLDPASGGGALYQIAGKLTVLDSDFQGNRVQSLGQGAALRLDDVEGTITNSAFVKHEGGPAIRANTAPVTIVGSTFAFNTCPQACDVRGDAIVLRNSVLVAEDKIMTPNFSGSIAASNNCEIFVGGGLGEKPSPFGTAPLLDRDGNGVEEYLLVQPGDTSCLDAGSDEAADDAGIPWRTLTTSGNGCLDVSPVDAGRHYPSTSPNPQACN